MMQQQSALVLHVRPYRESSAIVQFMTKEQGRIAGVVRVFVALQSAVMPCNPSALEL